jgi:hypothetical protein
MSEHALHVWFSPKTHHRREAPKTDSECWPCLGKPTTTFATAIVLLPENTTPMAPKLDESVEINPQITRHQFGKTTRHQFGI